MIDSFFPRNDFPLASVASHRPIHSFLSCFPLYPDILYFTCLPCLLVSVKSFRHPSRRRPASLSSWRIVSLSMPQTVPTVPTSRPHAQAPIPALRRFETIPTVLPTSRQITNTARASVTVFVALRLLRVRADNRRSPSLPSRVSSITHRLGTMRIPPLPVEIGARYPSGSSSARTI